MSAIAYGEAELDPRLRWPELFAACDTRLAELVARQLTDPRLHPEPVLREDARQLVRLVTGVSSPAQYETYMRSISTSAMSQSQRDRQLFPESASILSQLDDRMSVETRLILLRFLSAELAMELMADESSAVA